MILVARGKYIGTRLLRPAVQLTTQPPTTWTYSAWYSACVALCWSSSGARGPLSTARSSATPAHEPRRTPNRCSAASCSPYRQSSCPIYRTQCRWACLGSVATEQRLSVKTPHNNDARVQPIQCCVFSVFCSQRPENIYLKWTSAICLKVSEDQQSVSWGLSVLCGCMYAWLEYNFRFAVQT